ncbi:MAG: sigma-70 family RNA polymerase sigma factor [Cyanobacteria bacterium SIG31]|nr:sigma-70 family RNA polymerase sigma factor [Cyanobacteria bacterium SIG31]
MTKNTYKKGEIQQLVSLAQNGDIKALEELIRKVQKEIYAIFSHLCERKEDVSDLTQEALTKMAKSLSQLKDTKKFKSWLNQIITNLFYDYTRQKQDKFIDIDEDKLHQIKDKLGCEPGEKCLFTEIEKLIKAALLSLPKDLRVTIVLREFEGLSYEDIAKITNTALGTVKSRIARARIKLQQELKDFI